jgi:XRE family transcriptional regulator, fatty acid utilization regulator
MEQTPLSLRLLLGLKLRSFRTERQLGLRDLAELTGLSVSYLSEIETGRKYPKLQKLLTLASSLGVGYEDLVSLRTDERLGPIGELLSSSFFREFPLDLFRIEPEAVIQLMTESPIEAGALLRALSEIARSYDLRVEHFLWAALRAYQQLLHNHFPEIETAAEDLLDRHGWRGRHSLTAHELQKVLETEHGFTIEEETLAGHPVLGDLRAVFVAGPPGLKGRPRLLINGRLLPAQRAFLYGRELGYLTLGLVERSSTSTQISVDTFAQVINDFKAAYFSGALLLQRELLGADLRRFFALPRWSAEAFAGILASYETTPETFFYRLSQLLPAQLGLENLFFARLSHRRGAGIRLTKMLNMSQLPIPAGVEPQEHYCRRWPGSKLLTADEPAETGPLRAAIQRSIFLDGGGEYLQFSLARPLALSAGAHASVSLSIRLDQELKEKIAFWDDPGIERREVNTTCERCGLRDCLERAAPPTLRDEEERQKERAAALRVLFESQARGR